MTKTMTLAVLAAATALAGCSQSVQRASYPPASSTASLAAPTTGVQRAKLTPSNPTPPAASTASNTVAPSELPPAGNAPTDTATAAAPADTTTTAAVQPPAAGSTVASVTKRATKPVTREAMIGRWGVQAGSTNCEIFLALTKWSGGYRAATRGCSGSAIGTVQAWDVKDGQVVLIDSNGTRTASLGKAGATLYSGSTAQGGQISFAR